MNVNPNCKHVADFNARPECMAVLGLIPPYTVSDVKQAYLAKVRAAHPDVGGDTTAFIKVQKAYEEATDYVVAHTPDWHMIAEAVEIYRLQQSLIEELRKYGAVVQVQATQWLVQSWGEDFVKLTERIVGIRLQGPEVTDEVLAILLRHPVLLAKLRWLNLSHSKITDRGLLKLRSLPNLRSLNLAGTSVAGPGLRVLETLPELHTLDITGTPTHWTTKLRLGWSCSGLRIVSSAMRWPHFSFRGHMLPR
jgi:hypothetical protein